MTEQEKQGLVRGTRIRVKFFNPILPILPLPWQFAGRKGTIIDIYPYERDPYHIELDNGKGYMFSEKDFTKLKDSE